MGEGQSSIPLPSALPKGVALFGKLIRYDVPIVKELGAQQ